MWSACVRTASRPRCAIPFRGCLLLLINSYMPELGPMGNYEPFLQRVLARTFQPMRLCSIGHLMWNLRCRWVTKAISMV